MRSLALPSFVAQGPRRAGGCGARRRSRDCRGGPARRRAACAGPVGGGRAAGRRVRRSPWRRRGDDVELSDRGGVARLRIAVRPDLEDQLTALRAEVRRSQWIAPGASAPGDGCSTRHARVPARRAHAAKRAHGDGRRPRSPTRRRPTPRAAPRGATADSRFPPGYCCALASRCRPTAIAATAWPWPAIRRSSRSAGSACSPPRWRSLSDRGRRRTRDRAGRWRDRRRGPSSPAFDQGEDLKLRAISPPLDTRSTGWHFGICMNDLERSSNQNIYLASFNAASW
jgi:hypothetical protein